MDKEWDQRGRAGQLEWLRKELARVSQGNVGNIGRDSMGIVLREIRRLEGDVRRKNGGARREDNRRSGLTFGY
jgi:hypothetical protein